MRTIEAIAIVGLILAVVFNSEVFSLALLCIFAAVGVFLFLAVIARADLERQEERRKYLDSHYKY